MADRPNDPVADPAIDHRVEAFLHAELSTAERDFSRPQATTAPRRPARGGLLVALTVGAAALVLVAVVGGPRIPGIGADPSPTPSATPSELPTRPSPESATRIEAASLSDDGLTLTLEFTGGKEYVEGKPCTKAYTGWAEEADGILYAAVVDVTPARPSDTVVECTAEGHPRSVTVTLAEPFTGDRLVDIHGGDFALRQPASPAIPGALTSPPAGLITRIGRASLAADGMMLTLEFTGGAEYSPDAPCSHEYEGWAEAVGDTLHAAIVDVTTRPGRAIACNDVGYGRAVEITLPAPFSGARLEDLAGYVQFLRAPDGLVELEALPETWKLRSGESVEDSKTGRWRRVYAPDASPPASGRGRLELYQAFGGFADVGGGEILTTVYVNREEAPVYGSPGSGELVLAWQAGGNGFALVADKADFSVHELAELANSATLPLPADAWGPLAVIGPQIGSDDARTEGTLRVTADCVHILEQGDPVLLLWPSDQTSWDPATRSITFTNADGTTATVGDGSTVVLGGSGMSRDEDGELVDAWLAGMRWVAPPSAGCAAERYWTVGAMLPR